jgi:hypothetical protein
VHSEPTHHHETVQNDGAQPITACETNRAGLEAVAAFEKLIGRTSVFATNRRSFTQTTRSGTRVGNHYTAIKMLVLTVMNQLR